MFVRVFKAATKGMVIPTDGIGARHLPAVTKAFHSSLAAVPALRRPTRVCAHGSHTTIAERLRVGRRGFASSETPLVHYKEPDLFSRLWDFFVPLGMWSFVSLNIGAWFSQGDEGVQVLLHIDQFTEPILDPMTTRKQLTERLERLSRGVALNDTLKRTVLHTPGLIERLFEIIRSTETKKVNATSKNHAVKILEHVSALPDTQLEIVEKKIHLTLIDLLRDPRTGLYVKKTIATAVCNLASQPENVPKLGECCALSALHDEQALSKALRRQKVAVALGHLGAALQALPAEQLSALPPRERELIAQYAEAEREAASHPLYELRATLIESGVLLYLHTAAGGAVWGLFESLRLREPRAVLVQNVIRTSLVTCFIPILVVGGIITAYSHFNRTTDTVAEKFNLYFASCMAIYPVGRLLQWVERFAPLWLGGHIVGFFSFFVWTLYTESDLLKTDRDLLVSKTVHRRLSSREDPKKEDHS
mmetsp:Transcript_53657/g.117000  ORF Transcript_53657/g.117000 Transcript_53657/m.117000 type:complete len:477 (-) Transcript_53657:717-2147(-)